MTEGDGLASQENSCRNYATAKDYTVCAVFRDGVTGGTHNRKGLQQMLTFLESQGPGLVVIIDDLKRFAREVEVHFDLKRIITEMGARLESPLFRFEDTPEGKFIETIVAAQAELERNQNKRQVVSRMKARLEMGYWVFKVPPGYAYQRHPIAKKLLTPSPIAPLIKEAIEGFATGRFARVSDVVHFLDRRDFFQGSSKAQGTRHKRVQEILENIVYTGWLEYAAWGVSLRQGHHDPLISLDTHKCILNRLRGKEPTASDLPRRREFALRGVVRCASCGYGLTAYLSRGEYGGQYSYYHCWKQGCPHKGKSIRAEQLEEEFTEFLRPLVITDSGYENLSGWLVAQEAQQRQSSHEALTRIGMEMASVIKQENELIQAITRSQVVQVQEAMEKRLIELLEQKALLQDQQRQLKNGNGGMLGGEGGVSVRTLLDDVHQLVQNPLLLWEIGTMKERQLVARVTFPKSVSYERGKGLRTPQYALCYRVFGTVINGDSTLVDLTPIGSNDTLLSLHDCLPSVIEELRHWQMLVHECAEQQGHDLGQVGPSCGSHLGAEPVVSR